MPMELELGMLIAKLNPYQDTTMHLVPGNPANTKGAMEQSALEQNLLAKIEGAAKSNVIQALLEVETRQIEYLTWQFKDLPRLVKRAVRIEYRHLYKTTGLWVTDHLLVGYEGSNGG
jgi:hypothetical protein